ncbi:MAG: TIGR03618 family F420-dependent PPOX class oxidoreductase [Chloroflexi bacterium]|nr:TIGR03618 family F420-dependent PPOX class oxidoreductase [Chloroflexota bacterium]
MTTMSDEAREAFLAETRLGVLSTLRDDGAPISVPVWFEWDGSHARMFTTASSGKIERLARDARASLLVAARIDEPEAWVAIDGKIDILEEGAADLAERLAERYWDMDDPDKRATVDTWRRAAAMLRVLEMIPTAVRSYVG